MYMYLGVLLTYAGHQIPRVYQPKLDPLCMGILYCRFYYDSTPTTLRKLYVSFLRPNLEYASPVWNPHTSQDIQSLESVQRFSSKVCCKSWDMEYEQRLQTLHLPLFLLCRSFTKVCSPLQICSRLFSLSSHLVVLCSSVFL